VLEYEDVHGYPARLRSAAQEPRASATSVDADDLPVLRVGDEAAVLGSTGMAAVYEPQRKMRHARLVSRTAGS
jgi:hypothetical protein